MVKLVTARKRDDHRKIIFIIHTTKIFMRIINLLQRNQKQTCRLSNSSQYGFRKGSGTREAIFAVKNAAVSYLDDQKGIYMCFSDFQ